MKLDAMLYPRWAWIVVLPCVVAISGCGGKQMYHVRGKVTYKDGSVPTGMLAVVIFSPLPDSTAVIRKGASGAIEADGTFEMVTRMSGDGVNAGEYGVTFRILRDATTQTSLVSPKYTRPTSPAFTVKVDHDISDLSYEIEKADGAPAAAAASSPAHTPGPASGPGT
jgi:hypothetical protein